MFLKNLMTKLMISALLNFDKNMQIRDDDGMQAELIEPLLIKFNTKSISSKMSSSQKERVRNSLLIMLMRLFGIHTMRVGPGKGE